MLILYGGYAAGLNKRPNNTDCGSRASGGDENSDEIGLGLG